MKPIYTLSSTSGKGYGKEATRQWWRKRIWIWTAKQKTQFLHLLGIPVKWKTSCLIVNPSLSMRIPNVLQFYTPMELAEITNKMLTYEKSYFHGVLDMFAHCFPSLPKEIRAKWNGGLCRLLLDYIENR